MKRTPTDFYIEYLKMSETDKYIGGTEALRGFATFRAK